MPNWTEQQQDAITDRGHSLIVCAAAGSGKTAVLVERIAQLVKEGCPIEQMLIVTFTNAAAGEMRLRIGSALEQAARERPELGEQVLALSRASISTLHRFCGNLLREHFQALGIDPAFRIGDEQECDALARQAMEDALYACYEVGNADFLAADACYTQEALAELAQELHRFMMTRPDPQAWLEAAIEGCGCDPEALEESPAVRLLAEDARERLAQMTGDARQTLALCGRRDGPAHYAAACAQDVALTEALAAAAAQGYEPLRAALECVQFAALGRKKKGDIFDEELAGQVKKRRDGLKKAVSGLQEMFILRLEDAAADLMMTQAPLRGLAELVRTYDALYTAAKRQRGLMDFDDLEHGALRALAHSEVQEALAAQYRYVFIDEYQDSSAIQEAIVGSFAREDGLFLVGDVKQSIYRFRQAEPSLFLARAARYDREEETGARRIDLQRNFRSRANVLAGVNAVFARIMRGDVTEIEYDEREALIPGLPVREDDPPVELHLIWRGEDDGADAREETEEEEGPDEGEAPDGDMPDERELAAVEREALIAAQRIKALVNTPFYDAKAGGERPLAYRDMAILMRTARGTATLAADILQAEGIPVFCDVGEGYFDIPEIRAMMALLTTVSNGARDEALLSSLRGPALGLEDGELAAIRMHTPDSKTPYHEAVRRYREEKDDALSERLRGFEAQLSRWRLCARHQGVDRLIERIYAETGFLAKAGALPGGAARQANLHLLVSRARAFMQAQGGSLHAFLCYAERLHAGGDSMSASAIGESEDVVRIMTTHKSKGLEFPVVMVLGMGRGMSTRSLNAPLLLHAQLGVGLPCVDTQLGSERDTLLRRAIRVRQQREQLAEEVRILYVAMTRARERLILIGDTGKKRMPELWQQGNQESCLRAMRTGLDMVCPMLVQAGAACTIREEEVLAGESRWRVFAHHSGSAPEKALRSDETVMRMLAGLDTVKMTDGELARLLDFVPQDARRAVRKTSVSAVIRDEKRAAQEEEPLPARETEVMRLPRFMQETRMSGAQIGTAFHRMMRMTDLDALKDSRSIEAELAAQREHMLEAGIITQAEAKAVPLRMLVDFFASPLGVRLCQSAHAEREWAFTFRRTDGEGQVQLVQGVIDCCFEERGQWVLVDYKTDSPHDVQGAISRHRPQLELYAEALEGITGMPVRERVLYLVRAGAGYVV